MEANFPGANNSPLGAYGPVSWNKPEVLLFEPIYYVEFIEPTSFQKSYLTNELRKKFGKKLEIDPLLIELEIKEVRKLTNTKNEKDYKIYATLAEIKIKGKDLTHNQKASFTNIMNKVTIK